MQIFLVFRRNTPGSVPYFKDFVAAFDSLEAAQLYKDKRRAFSKDKDFLVIDMATLWSLDEIEMINIKEGD